jgi:putative membrane-bound dehydrogenase-like protein
VPTVKDARLKLELLASEPEIVTPTSLAADRQGRLYVAVTHTHSRGGDYEGPNSDRIVVFEDSDQDGRLDRSRNYADGLHNVLAVAFSRDDELHVVQMKSVVVLRDEDRDGRCESTRTLLTVDTPNNNHHGVLLALVFDRGNRLYVSLGNVGGSRYVIRGADGSQIAGQGDTGLVFRCRADGSLLERFAHGFWNPCDLRFDTAGRLLATDNDPDARGPNRVVHVIAGGRYGYKSRFGGSGLHPYCAWNGELPGTLPMVAGVGEAPVGLLDCHTAALPTDYADNLLVCVWGTNEVVRVRTRKQGASLAGSVEPLIVGDASFRPTGIVATTDGTVYIADWADRQYPVHAKGRIWRLAADAGISVRRPANSLHQDSADPGEARLARIASTSPPLSFGELLAEATQADPFVVSAAVTALTRPEFGERVNELLVDNDSARRIVGLMAAGRSGARLETSVLRGLLLDADPRVRKLALMHVGETGRDELADDVRQSVVVQSVSADLFETLLATVPLLGGGAKRARATPASSTMGWSVDQDFLRAVLADDRHPAAVRSMAVRYLADVGSPQNLPRLLNLAASSDDSLAAEAVRALAAARDPSAAMQLLVIARERRHNSGLRCDAIMSFVAGEKGEVFELLPLVADPDRQVALTAVRALIPYVQQNSVAAALHAALDNVGANAADGPLRDELGFALQRDPGQRPQTDQQWQTILEPSQPHGDIDAGRRVFFSQRASCAKCHSIEGRGGRIGPNLTNVAAAKTRQQILMSILRPSLEKSPDYQGYVVVMKTGQIHRGVQFHFRGESAELLSEEGRLIRFALRDAEEYRALDESLMPERLSENLSVGEMRDLVEYLASRRGLPAAADVKHAQPN